MQLVHFKDMQLFNVTLHKNSKLDSLTLGLTFQIENQLSCRKVLVCEIYANTKFHKSYVVQLLLMNVLS